MIWFFKYSSYATLNPSSNSAHTSQICPISEYDTNLVKFHYSEVLEAEILSDYASLHTTFLHSNTNFIGDTDVASSLLE